MSQGAFPLLFSTLGFAILLDAATATCPPAGFSSISNFDLDTFISRRWYIHQQMVTSYLPKSQNWCVFAEYRKLPKKSFWGYDIAVHNHAEEQDGTVHDSGSMILAKIVNAKAGQLEVGPYFLPTYLAGPYWVLDYSESDGYALISGGPPKESGDNGLCRTGSGVNNAGLWIFTREQHRNPQLIEKVRGIAQAKGFDLSVLNDVDHSKCTKSFDASAIASDVMV